MQEDQQERSQILPGVPASIPRPKVVELIEALGLSVSDLASLEFEVNGIYAEVYAHHPDHERWPNGGAHRHTVDGENVATHRICIPITDEKPDDDS
jgi:hypothetical protein